MKMNNDIDDIRSEITTLRIQQEKIIELLELLVNKLINIETNEQCKESISDDSDLEDWSDIRVS